MKGAGQPRLHSAIGEGMHDHPNAAASLLAKTEAFSVPVSTHAEGAACQRQWQGSAAAALSCSDRGNAGCPAAFHFLQIMNACHDA